MNLNRETLLSHVVHLRVFTPLSPSFGHTPTTDTDNSNVAVVACAAFFIDLDGAMFLRQQDVASTPRSFCSDECKSL